MAESEQPNNQSEEAPALKSLEEFKDLSLSDMEKELSSKDVVAFDTETTSLEIDKAKLLGISFSYSKNIAFYCDVSKEETLIDLYKDFFQSKTIKIAHNLKYDYGILFKYGIEINEFCFDTMIAHYLIDPEKRHNLDQLSRTILNYDPIPIESLIGSKTKPTKKMEEVEIDVLKNYAAEDADLTFQLYLKFSKELKNLDLEHLFYNIEIPLMRVLHDMERQGIKINTESLSIFSKDLNLSLAHLKQSIFQLSETEFNIDSPKQLGEVIFGKLNLDEKAKKTKTKTVVSVDKNEKIDSKTPETIPLPEKTVKKRSESGKHHYCRCQYF